MKLWFLLILALIFLTGCGERIVTRPQHVSTQVLLLMHNEERADTDDPPVVESIDLTNIAQSHAEWMARRGSLQHQSLSPILKFEEYRTAGENIACGQRHELEVLEAWMNSSGHRRNILNDGFEEIGIGVAETNGQLWWCVVFGG